MRGKCGQYKQETNRADLPAECALVTLDSPGTWND